MARWRVPRRRAAVSAASTACGGVSSWQITTSAAASTASCRAMVSRVTSPLLPATITIAFWLASSTTISATPDGAAELVCSALQSMPSASRPARSCAPLASAPTQPIIDTCAPSRAAATA